MPGNAGTLADRFLVRLSVAVHAPDAEPVEIREITARMAALSGVVAAEHDRSQGKVHVRYDMRKSASRLLRAVLHDSAATITPPTPAPALRAELFELGLLVTVAHEVHGRVRLLIERREDGPRGA